jgi:flagellar hook-basal body complex protein FliE
MKTKKTEGRELPTEMQRINNKVKQAKEKMYEKASRKVAKLTKKKKVKEVPNTLFGKQIRHNPKAHKLNIALAMSGIHTDIPTADLILQVFNKMEEMGGDFDMNTACSIKDKIVSEYEEIERKFKEGK